VAGDLILLPALLAGPLGRFFMVAADQPAPEKKMPTDLAIVSVAAPSQKSDEDAELVEGGETRHSTVRRKSGTVVRSDKEHRWPRH